MDCLVVKSNCGKSVFRIQTLASFFYTALIREVGNMMKCHSVFQYAFNVNITGTLFRAIEFIRTSWDGF